MEVGSAEVDSFQSQSDGGQPDAYATVANRKRVSVQARPTEFGQPDFELTAPNAVQLLAEGEARRLGMIDEA